MQFADLQSGRDNPASNIAAHEAALIARCATANKLFLQVGPLACKNMQFRFALQNPVAPSQARVLQKPRMKSNQIKSNQIRSNQIKSNQIKSNQIK
jgi:hypothetical protein